jgi:hypothetical protein
MDTSASTPQHLQNLHDFAFEWGKIIARRAFGEQGPPLDSDASSLEAIAKAAADGLLAGTLSKLFDEHARAIGTHQRCPTCQTDCTVTFEKRQLQFAQATIEYDEPVCYCLACRRDFFPSAVHSRVDQPPLRS